MLPGCVDKVLGWKTNNRGIIEDLLASRIVCLNLNKVAYAYGARQRYVSHRERKYDCLYKKVDMVERAGIKLPMSDL